MGGGLYWSCWGYPASLRRCPNPRGNRPPEQHIAFRCHEEEKNKPTGSRLAKEVDPSAPTPPCVPLCGSIHTPPHPREWVASNRKPHCGPDPSDIGDLPTPGEGGWSRIFNSAVPLTSKPAGGLDPPPPWGGGGVPSGPKPDPGPDLRGEGPRGRRETVLVGATDRLTAQDRDPRGLPQRLQRRSHGQTSRYN